MKDKSLDELAGTIWTDFSDQDWEDWYQAIVPYLASENTRDRERVIERLTTAVFWAEHRRHSRRPTDEETGQSLERTRWLLTTLEDANSKRPDILPFFLRRLRWDGNREPFLDLTLPWVKSLRQRRPDISQDLIEGTILLLTGLHWPNPMEKPPQFDDHSNFVRACAAYLLGHESFNWDDDDESAPLQIENPEFRAKLTAWELERPGLVGPYWTGADLHDGYWKLNFDAVDWLLDIVEKRSGPEPDHSDMDFNGVDFYLHEAGSGHPSAVRRLMAIGDYRLAVMTALDIHGQVEGMAEVLRDLGEINDPVARGAHIHLADYYGELHPKAAPSYLRHMPGWRPGVDAFAIAYGDATHRLDAITFFPADRGVFTEEQAWAIVDEALPPSLRGELRAPFSFVRHGAKPYRLGNWEQWTYAAGGQVELDGDPDARLWKRIDISGGRLQGKWNPFNW